MFSYIKKNDVSYIVVNFIPIPRFIPIPFRHSVPRFIPIPFRFSVPRFIPIPFRFSVPRFIPIPFRFSVPRFIPIPFRLSVPRFIPIPFRLSVPRFIPIPLRLSVPFRHSVIPLPRFIPTRYVAITLIMTPGKAKNKKNTNTFCFRWKKRKFANKMSFNENAKKTLNSREQTFYPKGFVCLYFRPH